jgi:hypothetical protein
MEDYVLSNLSITDLIEKCISLQAAMQDRLAPKDKLKVMRLQDTLQQLQKSFDTLDKSGAASRSVSEEGLTKATSQVQEILIEFHQFEQAVDATPKKHMNSLKNAIKRVTSNTDDVSEYLDDLLERLMHSVRVFRFAVSLNGYFTFQKDVSLSRMIADNNAAFCWMNTFGTSANSASFEDFLKFLDNYFTEWGQDSHEFEASCAQCNFFSWYRNEGSWSKCEACKAQLKKALKMNIAEGAIESKNEEVKLHQFAMFCGDNLLLAIRQVIVDAHPWFSDNKFQMISPALHAQAVFNQVPDSVTRERKLIFVGHSDHLAELHHQVCSDIYGQTVFQIDSVPNVEKFMDWVDAYQGELLDCKKGQILVVMDCQMQHSNCRHGSDEGHVESHSASPAMIAEGVVDYLTMKKCFNVGLSLLTCPFLIHDAQQVKKMNSLLQENFFQTYLLSSDCRKMSKFIQEMFVLPPPADVVATIQAPVTTSPAITSPAPVAEEDDFAASMAMASKKSEKDKKKKKGKN